MNVYMYVCLDVCVCACDLMVARKYCHCGNVALPREARLSAAQSMSAFARHHIREVRLIIQDARIEERESKTRP